MLLLFRMKPLLKYSVSINFEAKFGLLKRAGDLKLQLRYHEALNGG